MEDHGREIWGGRLTGMSEAVTITKENFDPAAPLPQADPFAGRDRQLYAVDPTGRNKRNGTVEDVSIAEELRLMRQLLEEVLKRVK